MLMNWRNLTAMESKEIAWSAWIEPIILPVSCCGKNPFGMMM